MSSNRNALLAAVLNMQAERLDDEALEAVRIRLEGFAAGGKLSETDKSLVWTSPSVRAAYLEARARRVQDVDRRWRAAGLALELVQRAADSSDDSRLISNAGVTLRILRAQALGDWLVSVELTPDAASVLKPGVRIRLVDTGGRVWVEGEPDNDLGIDAYWTDAEQSPIERLREHSILLELV